MKLENLTEAQRTAVELSRAQAGLSTPSAENLDKKDVIENKEELNEKEKDRIIKSGGLRPNALFSYYLKNWDDKVEKIAIKYPSSALAKRFILVSYNNAGAMNFNISDILDKFTENGLIKNLDEDQFPVPELLELAAFLTTALNNPRFR